MAFGNCTANSALQLKTSLKGNHLFCIERLCALENSLNENGINDIRTYYNTSKTHFEF
jgi:hypothetical protein